MNEPAILLEVDLQAVLRSAGVVIIALLLWAILSLLSSFFLQRRGRGLLNQLRFLFLPALIAFIIVRIYWPFDDKGQPTTALRIVETALAAAGVILVMGGLGYLLTPENLRRWFRRDIPALLIDVCRYLAIILAVAVILKTVWGEDVTPLIGALGIGGVVLGLALQETLGNFFNGLAMLAERPFSTGDWIRVGDGREGKVEHLTWRAVKILTTDNEYIIYPNSVVSKEKVVNYSLPSPVQAVRVSVGTSYDDPPDLVKRTIREVLADVPGVLAEPRPSIYTVAYADFSINYEIKFFIDNFAQLRPIQDRVMTRLWYAFRRRGIVIPFPIRHLYHHGALPAIPEGPEAPKAAEGAVRPEEAMEKALAAAPILADLSPQELKALTRGARLLDYCEGEPVVRQGDPGSALYAIVEGTARVALRGADGVEREVAQLKAGDVFGEMSLLTGDPRTATVYSAGGLQVAEVGKEALAPILEARPDLAGRMSELVVLRKEGLDRARAQAVLDEGKKKEIDSAAKSLLGRIKAFFGLR